MTIAWKQWENRVVDADIRLRQLLAESDHSAVFLVEHNLEGIPKAAVKLIPAARTNPDLQLSNWLLATKLSHPNLLGAFRAGACRLDGVDLLYLLMEYAEENLSQILPERALTADETRGMILPVLDALVFLHGKRLIHSRLKPANILAIGDQIRISTDSLLAFGEQPARAFEPSPYDPPEFASGAFSPAGDVWSFGVTLVETLTQQVPVAGAADPALPASLPEPFSEIVSHALRRDPSRRWTVADIAARLNPSARAIPAPAVPLDVPLSPVAPLPVAKQPATPVVSPAAQRPQPSAGVPRKTNYGLVAAAVCVALLLLIFVPRLLNHRPEAPSSTSAASNSQQPASPSPQAQQRFTAEAPAQPEPKPPATIANSKKSAAPSSNTSQPTVETASDRQPVPSADAPTPAQPHSAAPTTTNASRNSGDVARGEVLDQVLPEVSQKARNTIHGTVRVAVRVHVDPSGAVSSAEVDSPASSRFFADLALKAARQWQFQSPEVDGRSVPSEWLIRFEFTLTDTHAFPSQVAP